MSSRLSKLAFAVSFMAASVSAHPVAYAETLGADAISANCLSEKLISIDSVSATVSDVLKFIAISCGASLSGQNLGSELASQTTYSGTPEVLLERLSRQHRFTWVMNSGELSILNRRRQSQRLIPGEDGDVSVLRQELKSLGWLASEDSLLPSGDGRLIKVTGNNEFVALVELLQDENVNTRKLEASAPPPTIRIIKAGKDSSNG